jgi:hypothetical protein
LPDGGFALSGLQKQSQLKPPRPDKRQRHPALSLPHHCRMAATPYPAYKSASTATLILLSRKISQRWDCVPAEIGEPKRE